MHISHSPEQAVMLNTPWEHVPSSVATVQHLQLDEYQMWTRYADGVPRFLALLPDQFPLPSDGLGYRNIQDAITFSRY